MKTGRASFWGAAMVVVLAFGLPLFVQLGATDLKNDEPIYAFAIDRILDQGGWLTPKSIPRDDIAFLEKPPLKFWIVAATMRSGLLPRNEFGYRFWDAVFGVVAFVYVLAIGCRISGVVCGLTAVLVLFTHAPLIMEHGLRSNNMEAALLLAYCGGIYHALAWVDAPRRRRAHALALSAWCAFGFLVKFVAIAFLPTILLATAIVRPRWRRAAAAGWRDWALAAALAIGLSAPWFVYETRLFGREFWNTIFGQHVFVRFTAYLDPAHLHPWYYYLAGMAAEFSWSGDTVLVVAGLLLLVYRAVAERSDDAVLLLMWIFLPLAAISSGTSKLYHYVYPFLPPLALAAGLVPAQIMELAYRYRDPLASALERLWPRRRGEALPPWLRLLLILVAGVAIALAILTPITGGISLHAGGVTVFRNSTTSRPLIVATALLLFLGLLRMVPLIVAALVLLLLPFDAYRNMRVREVTTAKAESAPMRALRDCLVHLQAQGVARGVYIHTDEDSQWRYAYYLRDAGWSEDEARDDQKLVERVTAPGQMRPVFLAVRDYQRLRQRLGPAAARLDTMHKLVFDDARMLLLPGPYAACSAISGGGTHSGDG